MENPSLDLEATSNAFTGLAKLYRLQFIAEHCPVYTIEALKLAIRSAVWSCSSTFIYFISLAATVKTPTTPRSTRGSTVSWPTLWLARPMVRGPRQLGGEQEELLVEEEVL